MNSNISFSRPGHSARCTALPVLLANVNPPLRRPRAWRITRYLLPLLTLLALRFLSPAAHATDYTVSNAVLSVTLRGASGGIEVTDYTNTWMQTVPVPPPVYTATGSASNGVITVTVTGGGKTYNVVITLGSGKSFDFTEWQSGAATDYTKLPPYPFMFASPSWTGPWYYVQNTGGEGVLLNMTTPEVQIEGLGGWYGSLPWWGITNLSSGEAMMARLDTFRVTRPPDGPNAPTPYADDSIYAMSQTTPMKINYSFYSTGGYVGLAKTYRNYLLGRPENAGLQTLTTRAATQTNLNFLKNGTYAYFWDDSAGTQNLAGLIQPYFNRIIAMVSIHGIPGFADAAEYTKFNDLGWLGGIYQQPTPSLDNVCMVPDWVEAALINNATAAYLWSNKKSSWTRMNAGDRAVDWLNVDIPNLKSTYGVYLKAIYHDTLPQQVGPAFDSTQYTETAEDNQLHKQQILNNTRASVNGLDQQPFLAGSGEGNSAWWTIGHLDYWEGAMDNAGYADINTYHPSSDRDTVEFSTTYCDLTLANLNHSIRVPLLALGFHDYVAETWNWRNSTFVCETLSWKKDLFNILYGAMPMWNIDTFLWNATSNGTANSSKYIASYNKVFPVRDAIGFDEMLNHGWLLTDRSVQFTDWSGGKRVIVNFGDVNSYYYAQRDVTIAPHDYVMLTTNGDNIPPGPVTNLSAIPGDSKVTLNWTNPPIDFASAIVRRGTTPPGPATPSSGTSVAVVGQTATDTGLINGTPYYYSVFAEDAAGNFSVAAQVSATPAAIAFRAATSANTGSSSTTSLTISTPAGVLNGDLLLAGISFQNQGATVTPPSGWTLVRHISAGVGMDVYRKTAGTSEPASYQWSFSSTNKIAGGIIALSSVNLVTPIQGESGSAETVNRTTHTTPTISTTGSTTWLVTVFGDKNNTGSTWTPPSGHTERVDTRSTGTSAASVEINTKGPVSAGSQSATATASVASNLAAMEIIAVQP